MQGAFRRQTLSCECLNWICSYLNLREFLMVPAAWRTVRQTCRGGQSTVEDTIPGGSDFHWEAGEQHMLSSSLPSQAYPKELQTQTTGKVPSLLHPFNIPCENHTLSNTGQNVISQDYLFSELFSRIASWGFFLIDCAKNNPSGKDVVWLNEKAALCLSKFCYQCLRGFLAFDHLICVKPPKTVSKAW